jgi:hypothetical protein
VEPGKLLVEHRAIPTRCQSGLAGMKGGTHWGFMLFNAWLLPPAPFTLGGQGADFILPWSLCTFPDFQNSLE